MDVIERIRIDCLEDISRFNVIYTCLLLATAASNSSLVFLGGNWSLADLFELIKMADFVTGVGASASLMLFNESMLDYGDSSSSVSYDDSDGVVGGGYNSSTPYNKSKKTPKLLARMSKRLGIYLDQLVNYLESQFNEHTAASIASFSVLIIVLAIICCFIMSLMREEERRIKEQYKKLNRGNSSQSSININSGRTSMSAIDSSDNNNNNGAQNIIAPVAVGGGGGVSQRKSYRAANMSMSSAATLGKRSAGAGSSASGAGCGAYCKDSFSIFHGGSGDTGVASCCRYQKIIDQQSSLDSEQALLGEASKEEEAAAAEEEEEEEEGEGDNGQSTSKASPSSNHHQHQQSLFHNQQQQSATNRCRRRHRRQQQQQQQQQPNSRYYDQQNKRIPIDYNSYQQQQNYNSSNKVRDNKVRLHELRRETYFGLVRLSKPGCRTVVLLCDAQSRAKLLRKFYQCVYPYRKNKTLQFAFLLIERNIGWYKDLLKSALSDRRYLRINPINCIGTVLVLNGFKKNFSVYHASNSKCNPEYEEPPSLLLEEALLDNLPEWLERVFVGKVNQYYVESWPDRVQYTY